VVAIADAAADLVQKRDAWLNPPDASEAELKKRTLAHLYNTRPSWLADADRKLDEAVFAAYEWPPTLADGFQARESALGAKRVRVRTRIWAPLYSHRACICLTLNMPP
jgi:hypothetical protein